MGIIQMRKKQDDPQDTRVKEVIATQYSSTNQSLNLSLCRDYWEPVLAKRSWAALKHLHLQYCAIRIEVIVKREWPNLEQLQISGNVIGLEGVTKLMAKNWPKLETLGLNNCKINNEALSIITDKRLILKRLSIGGNQFSSVGISSLMKMDTSNLLSLSLFKNCMRVAGAKLFCKIDFSQLTYLTLGNCDLGNQGAKHISKCRCPNLNILAIGNNHFTFPGFECLYIGDWAQLASIQIGKFNKSNYMHESKSLEFYALLPLSAKKLQFQGSRMIVKGMREQLTPIITSRFQ